MDWDWGIADADFDGDVVVFDDELELLEVVVFEDVWAGYGGGVFSRLGGEAVG